MDDFVELNGIAFSPDEKKLYIIDTGFTDGPSNPSPIRVFDVDAENGKLSNSKVFAETPKPSITDGLRADRDGHIGCSVRWGDPNENGVRCYTAGGELFGKIHRRRWPIYALAASSVTGCTSAARRRSMPSTRVPRAL
jgi:gluconolactonase